MDRLVVSLFGYPMIVNALNAILIILGPNPHRSWQVALRFNLVRLILVRDFVYVVGLLLGGVFYDLSRERLHVIVVIHDLILVIVSLLIVDALRPRQTHEPSR